MSGVSALRSLWQLLVAFLLLHSHTSGLRLASKKPSLRSLSKLPFDYASESLLDLSGVRSRNSIFQASRKSGDEAYFAEVVETKARKSPWSRLCKIVAIFALLPFVIGPVNTGHDFVRADDELAKYAAEGNEVGVDGMCFMKKCALETSKCANDPTCLKGLSCLARCQGGSLCSTGCFAKYGSPRLDNLLYCSVEKHDCVHVPRTEMTGWTKDKLGDLPAKPISSFNPESLSGTWYKIMGLDSRYDCFDCQRNTFSVKPKNVAASKPKKSDPETIAMEAIFRVPRPTFPGYLQSKINEELHIVQNDSNDNKLNGESAFQPDEGLDKEVKATLQSQGQMFGLTFWENWYILGDSKGPQTDNNVIIKDEKLRKAEDESIEKVLANSRILVPKSYQNNFAVPSANAYADDSNRGVARTSGTNAELKNGDEINSVQIGEIDNKDIDNSVENRAIVSPGELIDKVLFSKPSPQAWSTASSNSAPDLKLVFYTGHTLQGSYKGAFLYARTPEITPDLLEAGKRVIIRAGLNPADFCVIRNQCFLNENKNDKFTPDAQDRSKPSTVSGENLVSSKEYKEDLPFWYIGQRFFQVSRSIAEELADWFEDPALLSDWLIEQQEKVVLQQPMAVSPFANLPQAGPRN